MRFETDDIGLIRKRYGPVTGVCETSCFRGESASTREKARERPTDTRPVRSVLAAGGTGPTGGGPVRGSGGSPAGYQPPAKPASTQRPAPDHRGFGAFVPSVPPLRQGVSLRVVHPGHICLANFTRDLAIAIPNSVRTKDVNRPAFRMGTAYPTVIGAVDSLRHSRSVIPPP